MILLMGCTGLCLFFFPQGQRGDSSEPIRFRKQETEDQAKVIFEKIWKHVQGWDSKRSISEKFEPYQYDQNSKRLKYFVDISLIVS